MTSTTSGSAVAPAGRPTWIPVAQGPRSGWSAAPGCCPGCRGRCRRSRSTWSGWPATWDSGHVCQDFGPRTGQATGGGAAGPGRPPRPSQPARPASPAARLGVFPRDRTQPARSSSLHDQPCLPPGPGPATRPGARACPGNQPGTGLVRVTSTTHPSIPFGARPCPQPPEHRSPARPARPTTTWVGPPAGGSPLSTGHTSAPPTALRQARPAQRPSAAAPDDNQGRRTRMTLNCKWRACLTS